MRRTEIPAGAARLLREDGSVVIPPEVAADVLRRLSRDVAAEVQANGGTPTGAMYRVMWALFAAARAEDERGSGVVRTPGGSVAGTSASEAAMVETAAEAARRMGCSAEYVRRLARSGRVPGRKVGAQWLITTAAGAATDPEGAA